MRFESARDAIKHARTFHRELSEIYSDLATKDYSDKTKLLLEYVSHQERSLADSLTQYEESSPAGILDTWIQYADDQNILKPPTTDSVVNLTSVEDIVALSSQMSDEFITLYHQVKEQLDEQRLKDIFTNLAEMQTQKQRRLTINYDRLMDI